MRRPSSFEALAVAVPTAFALSACSGSTSENIAPSSITKSETSTSAQCGKPAEILRSDPAEAAKRPAAWFALYACGLGQDNNAWMAVRAIKQGVGHGPYHPARPDGSPAMTKNGTTDYLVYFPDNENAGNFVLVTGGPECGKALAAGPTQIPGYCALQSEVDVELPTSGP